MIHGIYYTSGFLFIHLNTIYVPNPLYVLVHFRCLRLPFRFDTMDDGSRISSLLAAADQETRVNR